MIFTTPFDVVLESLSVFWTKLSISFLQKECVQDPTSSNGLNPQGCFQMVLNEINKHESIIGSVAIVIAAVMVSISTYFPSNT